ncbi:hypothetical protein ACH5RR_032635 [Cinchona calisaya]|uniref:F-box domain-containing protein n=1 Tax=Cinchona calisaya TaxID=153742 RepID=A0ABD2YIP5_9GENT
MHIPPEVYEKIRVRLEVKDLLRFKCVCRCWADIISSSFFVHRQLEQSKEDPDQNHRRIFLIFPHVTIPYNSCDDKEDSKSVSRYRFDDRRTNTVCMELEHEHGQKLVPLGRVGETVYISKVFEDRRTFLNGIVHWPTYEPSLPNRLDFVVLYDLSPG